MKMFICLFILMFSSCAYAGHTRAPGANYPDSALRRNNYHYEKGFRSRDNYYHGERYSRRWCGMSKGYYSRNGYIDCPGYYYDGKNHFYHSASGYYDSRGRYYHSGKGYNTRGY